MDFTWMILLSVITATLGFPTFNKGQSRTVGILQHDEVRDQYGQYAFRYITEDGTVMNERGRLKPTADGTGHILIKEGSVSYQAPDGSTVYLEYVADENGFRPSGSHIPTTMKTPPRGE